ncbi:uncharacterized protein LOC127805954 [Diospyros lotus]|uniref:uncharacterized protein LOC127805954 n=1 Tax=Diospyros lotus TaxID=55363 RepID=UPI002253AC32|nr:uncharacterized protein LOC127805954 [Diospyros lotus]
MNSASSPTILVMDAAASGAKALAFCSKSRSLSIHGTISSRALGRRRSFSVRQRAPKPRTGGNILFLTRCSTRPGIDSDSATNQNNPAIEMGGGSSRTAGHPETSTLPNQALPSTISKGLVLALGSEDSWDGAELGSPVVKRFVGDDEERWYMWYHGRPNGAADAAAVDCLGLAVSSNGIHWARGTGAVRSSGDVGLVMNCRENWWAFDTNSIRPSELIMMPIPNYSSVYWLYYTGFCSEELELESLERLDLGSKKDGKILKSLPGLACSQDGRHWTRIEGENHSGALLEVGAKNEWDSSFIASPKVVFHGRDDLRMYYHSFDLKNGKFAVGLARSRDGIRWVKLGKILGGGSRGCFDELGSMNPHVVRNPKDGSYLMAYEGVDAEGVRSIGMAVSSDRLRQWDRLQDAAVLTPSEQEGWDNKGVGSPYLVHMKGLTGDDQWRLYYKGVGDNGRTGIGMAVCEGSQVGNFKRWEGLQL